MFPRALTASSTVAKVPRSAETIAPTCFIPFSATIFFGFSTVWTPVSSKFQIREGVSLYFVIWLPNFSKNSSTLCQLNEVARPALVASGVLIESVGFLFKNLVNQSLPASPFLCQDGGMF